MAPDRVQNLLADLEAWFAGCDSALVAFSGGVDSSLVAYLARQHLGRDGSLAVIGQSASLKARDLAAAHVFASTHDLRLRVIETTELSDPLYRANPEDRCFHCKSTLFCALDEIRRDEGLACILGGENADDHGDYRPGLRAVARFGVRGPLAECGIGKDDLRRLARHLGLECWEKPASPCLSSRIPYHEPVTAAKLRQIEAAETWLETRGFDVARVRHHGELARVEVPPTRVDELAALGHEMVPAFLALGFARVEIDREGFVSGKLNRAIG